MYKAFNILMLLIILFFIFNVFKYYSSNKNIENTNFNRTNIDEILRKKIADLPVLKNDTDRVIFYNDQFSEEIQNENPRSFWNLLKNKWKKKLL